MAKKNINDKNPTKINDNKFGKGELTIVDGNEASFLKESVLCSGVQKQHHISRLNIIELVALEKACSLLCKRYEIIARIDDNNNEKFKEYKGYYDMIFKELENRVYESCKI